MYLPLLDLTDVSSTHTPPPTLLSLFPHPLLPFTPSTMIRKQREGGGGEDRQSWGMCGRSANVFICTPIMGAATVSCGERPLLKVSVHKGQQRAQFPVIKQDTLT